jgi:serine protease Do
MKKIIRKPLMFMLAAVLMLPAALLAQVDEKDKDKDKHKDKDGEQIVITRKGSKNEKVIVEINGDKVTVNGKPLDEYEGDDVIVQRKSKDAWAYGDGIGQNWNFDSDDNFKMFDMDSDRAMLGVTTEKVEKGVEIQSITKESGAAKAGLKEDDIITKIDDKKIETPDDLSKFIKSHKPGDKVSINYLRDGKEQKTTAELGKWKGAKIFSTTPGFNYKMDMGEMDFDHVMPKIQSIPRMNQSWSYSGGSPKLGLSIQDTENGKGVKVIEVDDESNAEKAGIEEDDIITEVEGKAANSADEVAKIIKASKDKTSVMIKLQRNGKTHNIEVKIPRKLKTADL